MLRMLLDHSSFSILEAVHTSSRETALVAAVRLCNVEAVKTLTEAGADILHQINGIPLLHATIRGSPTHLLRDINAAWLTCGYCPKKPVEILKALLVSGKAKKAKED